MHYYTAVKMSIFWVFLVHIFPHSDWIRRDTDSPFSVRIRENTDQSNSEYGHFLQCWFLLRTNAYLWKYQRIILFITKFYQIHMGQSIQEWTKQILWKRLSSTKLLSPVLNTLSHIISILYWCSRSRDICYVARFSGMINNA